MPILPSDLALPPLQNRGGRTPRYGADVSFYLPTSGRVRSLFGSDWVGVGPAFSPVSIAQKTAFRPDVDFLSQSKHGNDALLVFAGGEVVRAFGRPNGIFLPYAGAGAGLLYADVDADSADVSYTRLTFAGSAFVGTRLTRNAYVEARYRFVPSMEGLDFSGTSITFGVRF